VIQDSLRKTSIAIGDIHGCLEQLCALLEREDIIDSSRNWSAGNSSLIFLGDYMDRGQDGIGVLDFIMHLETQAKNAGGEVIALLGNHDVIMLEAYYFGDELRKDLLKYGQRMTFKEMWLGNAGGHENDLRRIEKHHLEWLRHRPVMHKIGKTLLTHADSEFYLEYGDSIENINASIQEILKQANIDELDKLEERFSSRLAFAYEPTDIARSFAAQFSATRIVHGHTPIFRLRQLEVSEVTEPFIYADGICINLDHALCYGGLGFVYRF
jgi:hypothetical protein